MKRRLLEGLVVLALFFGVNFTSQAYGQDTCSAPSCPTLIISGPDKVSYGEVAYYTLNTGAPKNITWSVDNPRASISGSYFGAFLTVNNACDCNNGAITITAKDTGTGCYTTFRVQAGTWVPKVLCGRGLYECGACGGPFCSAAAEQGLGWWEPIIRGNLAYTYTRYSGSEWPGQAACQADYGAYGGPSCSAGNLISVAAVSEWECPAPSQSCNIPCSLSINDFKGFTSDSYSETVCLSGLIDANNSVAWTIEIKDSAGMGIKQFNGSGAYGAYVAATWDGRDGSGNPVAAGTYTATLAANTTDGGCSSTSSLTITVVSLCTDEICDGVDNNCNGEVDEGACSCSVNTGGLSTANMSSGNLHHDQELFSTRGTNLTLHYNSIYGYNGPLGKGWGHTYDVWLKEHSDGSILLRNGNERGLYIKNDNSYTSQPGDYSTLIKNTDDTFTITHKDGLKYNFNGINKISSIVDRNGNTITFAYTIDGDLISIVDTVGRTTTLSYNTDHRISAINDPNGNTHSFTYSGNDLIGVSTLNSELGTLNWVYTYYENSFMHTKIDPNGYTTTYTYDEDHRVISGTDPEGNVKSIAYPSIDDTSQSKTTSVTEKDGGNWTYSYDTQAGTLTQKTDPENGTTSYTYDANRNQTSKTEPDGSVTSYTYDASGNMASTTDALNQTTAYAYNSYGQVTGITAPDATTTSYVYDTNGNLTKTTDSTGASTSYQYDAKGNVTKITNAAGQTTTFTYDQSGNLSSIKDSTGATTSFTYDTAGNMTSQTDASGATTYFQYNSLNQLVKVIDPNGNSTTNTYDANGNKTSSTDANGNVTYYEYNYKGQLIKVKDALGNAATYTYGGTGCSSCGGGADKLTAITDANGNATEYEYDKLGRLAKETDPLRNAISYSYDSKGNLVSKTDANGATVSYSYDALSRLIKKAYPDNTTETYIYDSKGNILTATNSNISYTLSYNTNGKTTSVTDSSGRAVSYQYDTLGNKTKLTYPEGSSVTYSYDTANRLTKITNGGGKTYSYQYDSLGRRTKLTLPNGTSANYSYDTSGRLTSLTHKTSSNSTIASFAYTHDNVGNRLTKALDTGTKHSYTYDAIYRLTEALSSTPGYSSNTTGKGSGTTTATQQQKEFYTYDPVGNRLTSDKYSAYTYNQANQLLTNGGTYGYDKNGNLISKIDGSTTYTYSHDYENRLVKVIKTENGAITTSEYKYDPFGRRIEKRVAESGATTTARYVYDNEDIIIEYDGSGNIGNRYIHGPGIDEPLAVINGKNTYYYHGDGLGSIGALTDSTGKTQQTYEYDSFGNLKDQKNKIKQPYTYTGREWDKEAGLYYLRARFYDPKVGRFISFDPVLHPANGPPAKKGCGNNASEPSFNDLLSRPLELNPFVYTTNNPINKTDPLGLMSEESCYSGCMALCTSGSIISCTLSGGIVPGSSIPCYILFYGTCVYGCQESCSRCVQ